MILRRIIERRWLAALIVLGGILLFVGTLKICGQRISMGFVENNDYGKIFVRLEFPPYYDLEHTVERVHEIEKLFEPLQDRLRTFSLVGREFPHEANRAPSAHHPLSTTTERISLRSCGAKSVQLA